MPAARSPGRSLEMRIVRRAMGLAVSGRNETGRHGYQTANSDGSVCSSIKLLIFVNSSPFGRLFAVRQ
jgi:hypothetical protein